jgi:hypothetical protein
MSLKADSPIHLIDWYYCCSLKRVLIHSLMNYENHMQDYQMAAHFLHYSTLSRR